MTRGYSEYRFWSPMLGGDAARISMVDDRGGEFYQIIDAEGRGSTYRARREAAIEVIAQAIEMGLAPGQVMVV